jgi:hypothetical protein
MKEKLNDHQIKRIMFLLLDCLDKRILNNPKEIATKRKTLEDTIEVDIRQELTEAKNNKCEEIISNIIRLVNDILSSHASYRLSLERGK